MDLFIYLAVIRKEALHWACLVFFKINIKLYADDISSYQQNLNSSSNFKPQISQCDCLTAFTNTEVIF